MVALFFHKLKKIECWYSSIILYVSCDHSAAVYTAVYTVYSGYVFYELCVPKIFL